METCEYHLPCGQCTYYKSGGSCFVLPPLSLKIASSPVKVDIGEAVWKMCGGWKSNHDKMIDDATCSACGYKHPTVRGSLSELVSTCPQCGRRITLAQYENGKIESI